MAFSCGRPEEEMTTHVLLYCAKMRIIWQLLFSFFGVLDSLFIGLKRLFRWQWSFVVKESQKMLEDRDSPVMHFFFLFFLFWTMWRERNMLTFDYVDFSIQRMKYYFVYNLWSSLRVSMDMSSNFIEWISSK